MDLIKQKNISIIIPTYNSSKTIQKTLNSIIKNIYEDKEQNIEIVIVDDNSVDDTINIVNDFFDNENFDYKLIKNEKNLGAGYSRNVGIINAKYENIIFVDSDDELLSNIFDELENEFDLIIYGFNEIYFRNGKIVFEKDVLNTNLKDEYNNFDELKKEIYLFEKNTSLGYIWNKRYKKSIIIDNNIEFGNEKLYEDLFFNIEYFKHIKNAKIIKKSFYKYNNMSDDNSSVTKKDYDNYFDLAMLKIKKLKDFFENINNYNENEKTLLTSLCKRYMISAVVRKIQINNDRKSLMDFIDSLKNIFKSFGFEESNFINNKYLFYIYCKIVCIIKIKFNWLFLRMAK